MHTEYCYFIRGAECAGQAVTSIASVRRADPQANVMVVTDDRNLPPIEGCGAVFRAAQYIEPIQLAKLTALTRMAMTSRADRLVFLDTDTIVRRPASEWPQADLYVTWRDHVAVDEAGEKVLGVADVMPYNGGVYGVTPQSPGLEAMLWLRECVARQPKERHVWNGDQYALHALVGPPPKAGLELRYVPLAWRPEQPGGQLLVAALPCDTWNHTPAAGAGLGDAAILHFKGHSRARFIPAALELGLPIANQEAA